MNKEEFGAFVGIDWSDRKHDICLKPAAGEKLEQLEVLQKPEALDEWARGLHKRFKGMKIAVCLEQSRGPLIAALLKYDFFVLYPVNPSVLANYREAFSPSRAKDDPTDAEYLVELLEFHQDRLTPWVPDDEHTRRLQYLVEYRRKLIGERTRISNRLTSYLKMYFPQVLEWFPDIRTELICEFLLRWPSLESLKGVRKTTLLKFFVEHGSRSKARNEKRLEEIKTAVPLTTDKVIVDTSATMVCMLCEQMKVVIGSIKKLEKEIEQLYESHVDCQIFSSLPAAGENCGPRMLAAFGCQRERFKSADDAAKYFGIAPVMERSGTQEWIHWRFFCPKFIRQSFHEFANQSIHHSYWAHAFYAMQRAKGKEHHVAVRALAFKWIRIIFRCWQEQTTYNEATYLKALQKRGSKLLAYAASSSA